MNDDKGDIKTPGFALQDPPIAATPGVQSPFQAPAQAPIQPGTNMPDYTPQPYPTFGSQVDPQAQVPVAPPQFPQPPAMFGSSQVAETSAPVTDVTPNFDATISPSSFGNASSSSPAAPPPAPVFPETQDNMTGQSLDSVATESSSDTPPSQPENVNEVLTKPTKKRSSIFKLFLILATLAILGIWGFVGYMYLKNNNKLPFGLSSPVTDTSKDDSSDSGQNPSPGRQVEEVQLQIVNGNVMQVKQDGERLLLISKDNYEETGIAGFSTFSISPDNLRVCLESSEPSPEPSIYLSTISGGDVLKIGAAKKDCKWTPDARKIVYTGIRSNENPYSDVFSYDVVTGIEENYTGAIRESFPLRSYSVDQVIADTINCTYEDMGSEGAVTASGSCSINIETSAVTSS